MLPSVQRPTAGICTGTARGHDALVVSTAALSALPVLHADVGLRTCSLGPPPTPTHSMTAQVLPSHSPPEAPHSSWRGIITGSRGSRPAGSVSVRVAASQRRLSPGKWPSGRRNLDWARVHQAVGSPRVRLTRPPLGRVAGPDPCPEFGRDILFPRLVGLPGGARQGVVGACPHPTPSLAPSWSGAGPSNRAPKCRQRQDEQEDVSPLRR